MEKSIFLLFAIGVLLIIVYKSCSNNQELFTLDNNGHIIGTTRAEMLDRGLIAPRSNSRYSAIILPKNINKNTLLGRAKHGENITGDERALLKAQRKLWNRTFIQSDSVDRIRGILNVNNNNPYYSDKILQSRNAKNDCLGGTCITQSPMFINELNERVPINYKQGSNIFS